MCRGNHVRSEDCDEIQPSLPFAFWPCVSCFQKLSCSRTYALRHCNDSLYIHLAYPPLPLPHHDMGYGSLLRSFPHRRYQRCSTARVIPNGMNGHFLTFHLSTSRRTSSMQMILRSERSRSIARRWCSLLTILHILSSSTLRSSPASLTGIARA